MTADRVFAVAGSLSALMAVAAGAFAAHALRGRVTGDLLVVFETGARYQMYHALALLGTAWLVTARPGSSAPVWAGVLFLIGTAVFSGSLYALALTGQRWLGAITPVGGVAFLAGWACVAWAAVSRA